MGSGKAVTVGYWYRLLLHYGMSRGPIDAFLEFRAGDRTAWAGQLTETSEIYIDAENLWGGEKSEGGVSGHAEILFGQQDQMPNAWLAANQGPDQPGYRGKATFLFKGGRFGINPYPKSVAFKLRRIEAGWDADCWYPETAAIPYAGENTGHRVQAISNHGWTSPIGSAWEDDVQTPVGAFFVLAAEDRYLLWDNETIWYTTNGEDLELSPATFPGFNAEHDGVFFKGSVIVPAGLTGIYRSADKLMTVQQDSYPDFPRINWVAASPGRMLGLSIYNSKWNIADNPGGPWTEGADSTIVAGNGIILRYAAGLFMAAGSIWDVGLAQHVPYIRATADGMAEIAQPLPALLPASHFLGLVYGDDRWLAITNAGEVLSRAGGSWQTTGYVADAGTFAHGLGFVHGLFYILGSDPKSSVDGVTWNETSLGPGAVALADGVVFDTRTYASLGMNGAHIILDSLIAEDMQGEPIENIDLDSFTLAADRLYGEEFALCTTYDHASESSEDFQKRICGVIGAALTQSRIDGRYRLDLIRGDYDPETLPILTDGDILEYKREPSNPNDSVNEVIVEWFDPLQKEKRATTPLQSLGAIQSIGGVISETAKYPELPAPYLAQRVAARDLKAKSSPLNRFTMTTTRKTYNWRSGTFFRLQAPRRGIADMICMVGEINAGTARSAAMTMIAIQDVTGMPDTVYVAVEPGIDTAPAQIPTVPTAQRLIEAPYIELAGALPTAAEDLAPDAGYVLAMGARAVVGLNYRLLTQVGAEAFERADVFDWCPTGTVDETATSSASETEFTLSDGLDLDRVTVGTAALWGEELVRVDGIDASTGAITIGRGVGDTVPQEHAALERMWFYDAWNATDLKEYTDGDTVSAKLLTRTSSRELTEGQAVLSTVDMNSRASRPYPPGRVRIDAEPPASVLGGYLLLSWAHRDRLLQADQLIDNDAASIGPEPTTRYALRFLDGGGNLIIEKLDIAGSAASATVNLDYTGDVTMELYSISDNGDSWQRHEHTFDYTPPGGSPDSFIDAPTYGPDEIIIDGGGDDP